MKSLILGLEKLFLVVGIGGNPGAYVGISPFGRGLQYSGHLYFEVVVSGFTVVTVSDIIASSVALVCSIIVIWDVIAGCTPVVSFVLTGLFVGLDVEIVFGVCGAGCVTFCVEAIVVGGVALAVVNGVRVTSFLVVVDFSVISGNVVVL